jgi:hypothetical protein
MSQLICLNLTQKCVHHVYWQESSYFFFMAAHGWFAYFFLQTTTLLQYHFENKRNIDVVTQGIDNVSSHQELTPAQKKQFICQKWGFLVAGALMFWLGLGKSLYIQNVHRKRKPYESFLFAMTQLVEIAVIIVPLVISLYKLRRLKTKYGLQVQ